MSDVRASDAEREQVAAEIREHFAQGRLDAEEMGERLERAYAARTRRDLDELRGDLPRLPVPVGARRAELTKELIQQTGAGLGLFAMCTLIWLATGAHGNFWPVWTLWIPLIPLVRNGWRLYGPAPDLDRVERDLRHRREHRHR